MKVLKLGNLPLLDAPVLVHVNNVTRLNVRVARGAPALPLPRN